MSNKLLSVIVPIYNREECLKRCIESIRNQTYQNLEIILVDDGSMDNSPEICDDYLKVDSRIKVVHKKNGGLSSARNAGMQIATGEYVTFVDSDDYIEIQVYEILIKEIEAKKCDIITMNFQDVEDDGTILNCKKIPEEYLGTHNSEWYFQKMCERKVSESVCFKIFKMDFIKNKTFDETKTNEDFLFMSNLLLEDANICITNHVGYNYVRTKNSLSRSGFGKSLIDAVYNTNQIQNKVQELSKKNLLPYIGAYNMYQASRAIIAMGMSQYRQNKEFVVLCKRSIKKNIKYLKNSMFTKKDRIFCKMYVIFPSWTKFFSDMIFRGKR